MDSIPQSSTLGGLLLVRKLCALWGAVLLGVTGCAGPASSPPKALSAALAGAGTSSRSHPASVPVLVWGATPAGLAAAAAAANAGERTLILSPHRVPGGLITRAWLTVFDMNRSSRGLLTQGAFTLFYGAMGKRDSFSLSQAQDYFNRLATGTPNLVSGFNVKLLSVSHNGDSVSTIKVAQGGKTFWIRAKRFIDASGTAALAARAGAQTFYGYQDIGAGKTTSAASLIFRLKGVNWQRVMRFTGEHRRGAAWGYGAVDFKDHNLPKGMALRGMNLSLQPNGTVLVNALWVDGVDPLNPKSVHSHYKAALAALPSVVRYLNGHDPGFSQATLEGAAPAFYIRQSRQIVARTQLTAADELQNRCFSDRIAMANYPVDLQGTAADPHGLALFTPQAYSIPFGALIPKGLSNLLVAGSAAGYSSVAQGSARVIPVGIVEGQAAGLAASLSLEANVSFPKLDTHPFMARLQKQILAHGGFLGCFAPAPRLVHSWIWPYFKGPLNDMMLSGGYTNTFHLGRTMSETAFSNWLADAPRLLSTAGRARFHPVPWTGSSHPVSVRRACNWILEAAGKALSGGCSRAGSLHLLSRSALSHLHPGLLTRAEGLVLISSLASTLSHGT